MAELLVELQDDNNDRGIDVMESDHEDKEAIESEKKMVKMMIEVVMERISTEYLIEKEN